MGFAYVTLVAVLSNAGLTEWVASFTILPWLVFVIACWAFIHTGAICTKKHTWLCCYANKPQMPEELFRTCRLQRIHEPCEDHIRLTEQEMSLAAAQAVGFSRTGTPVAVFVTWMTFPILVCVLVSQAFVDWWYTMAVTIKYLTLCAAGAGASVGPKAGKARRVTVWKFKQRKHINTAEVKHTK